ncbi:hypothetical protein CE143_13680 [Photorhabdus luminescens]|uniref:Uncharacterized protein n=1 Tax=Photorhabdus akhurstii TaxID=171438 RepID=A0ABX8LZ05_9GAMM|nr:hypothetical protein B0X70_13685 [Photorhabdus akhurstii]UJD75900.1 hypothetical protein CE143_13680 [Photorhabdus luminescens]
MIFIIVEKFNLILLYGNLEVLTVNHIHTGCAPDNVLVGSVISHKLLQVFNKYIKEYLIKDSKEFTSV